MSLAVGQILKVCRVCESTENLIDISTVKYSHLNEKLHKVAEFKFQHKYSCYFKFICITCSLQLENSFDFKTQCENTYIQLLNQLETLSENSDDNVSDADTQSDGIADEFKEANETKYSDLFEMVDSSDILDYEKNPGKQIESLQDYFQESTCDDGNEGVRHKRQRVKSVQSDRVYTCAFCGKEFRNRYYIIGHIEGKHLKIFRYKCGLCDKKFAYSAQMCRHRKAHFKRYLPTSETFSCGLCGKELKTKMILKKHLKVVHLKLNKIQRTGILCDLCGQRSVCMATHKEHMNIHRDARPYKCEHCDKTFRQKQGLTAHVKIHTDERNYKCTLCPKAFRTRGHIKHHIKVHNDVRDHECRSCGKAFRNISSLKMHLRLHTGETPYECKHCSKKFSQTRLLGNHMKVCSAISNDINDERREM